MSVNVFREFLKQIKICLYKGDTPEEIASALDFSEENLQRVIKLKNWMDKRDKLKKRMKKGKQKEVSKPEKPQSECLGNSTKKAKQDEVSKPETPPTGNMEQFESALLKWLKEQNAKNDITLFNILEKAEGIATKILGDSNKEFKVSDSWFRDFRRKHKLEIKTAEEVEIIESRKLAKRLKSHNERKPDFVWGECDGCDGVDCPVHEWGSRLKKITPQKKFGDHSRNKILSEKQKSVEGENKMHGKLNNAKDDSQVNKETNMNLKKKNGISCGGKGRGRKRSNNINNANDEEVINLNRVKPGISVLKTYNAKKNKDGKQQVPIEVTEVPSISITETESNVQRPLSSKDMEHNDDSSDTDSDSSHFIIAEDDDEEMEIDENIVKTEESVISFGQNSDELLINNICDKSESTEISENCDNPKRRADDQAVVAVISLDSDDSASDDHFDKLKEAFELFQKGLSIVQKHDSVVERKQLFDTGLRQLLMMYNIKQ